MSKFLKIVAFALIAIVATVSFMGCEAALSGADGADGTIGADGTSKTDVYTLGGVQDWNNIATSDIVGKTKSQAPFFGEESTDNPAYAPLAIEALAADGSNALHMSAGSGSTGFYFTNLFTNVAPGIYKITTSLKVGAAGNPGDEVLLEYNPVAGFGSGGTAGTGWGQDIDTSAVTAFAEVVGFIELTGSQSAVKLTVWGNAADIIIEKITIVLSSASARDAVFVGNLPDADYTAGVTQVYNNSIVADVAAANLIQYYNNGFISWGNWDDLANQITTANATEIIFTHTADIWGPLSLLNSFTAPVIKSSANLSLKPGTYTVTINTGSVVTLSSSIVATVGNKTITIANGDINTALSVAAVTVGTGGIQINLGDGNPASMGAVAADAVLAIKSVTYQRTGN